MLLVTLTIIIGCATAPVIGWIVLMEMITPGVFFQIIQDPEIFPRLVFDVAYSGLLTLKISVPLSLVTVAVCYSVRRFIKRKTNAKKID